MSLITWQTTGPLSHDKVQVPYPMTECKSLIPWQSTSPLSHNRVQVPYPMTEYKSLIPWQTTVPLSHYIQQVPYSMIYYRPFYLTTYFRYLLVWQKVSPFCHVRSVSAYLCQITLSTLMSNARTRCKNSALILCRVPDWISLPNPFPSGTLWGNIKGLHTSLEGTWQKRVVICAFICLSQCDWLNKLSILWLCTSQILFINCDKTHLWRASHTNKSNCWLGWDDTDWFSTKTSSVGTGSSLY